MAKAGQGKAAKPKAAAKRPESPGTKSSRGKSSHGKSSPRDAIVPVELIERIDPPSPPARADSMKLAAEVARLEFELAVARAQMVDLAARAETDPLTHLTHRRAFEPALRRAPP